VRVELPAGTDIAGFIPRPVIGFQAKAEDMPASKIAKEMRPETKKQDGTYVACLRPSIRALADLISNVLQPGSRTEPPRGAP
jgi:hypothetical protein